MGRPSKITKTVIQKLDEAFAIGASVPEACFYAGIAKSTFYDWVKNKPTLSDRFDALREKLPLKARNNIAASIQGGDLGLSRWYLEKRKPEEFGDKIEVKHSGEIGTSEPNPEDEELRLHFKEQLKENIRRRAAEKAKREKDKKA